MDKKDWTSKEVEALLRTYWKGQQDKMVLKKLADQNSTVPVTFKRGKSGRNTSKLSDAFFNNNIDV